MTSTGTTASASACSSRGGGKKKKGGVEREDDGGDEFHHPLLNTFELSEPTFDYASWTFTATKGREPVDLLVTNQESGIQATNLRKCLLRAKSVWDFRAGYAVLSTRNLTRGRNSSNPERANQDYDYVTVIDPATIVKTFGTRGDRLGLVQAFFKQACQLSDKWNRDFSSADKAGSRIHKEASYQLGTHVWSLGPVKNETGAFVVLSNWHFSMYSNAYASEYLCTPEDFNVQLKFKSTVFGAGRPAQDIGGFSKELLKPWFFDSWGFQVPVDLFKRLLLSSEFGEFVEACRGRLQKHHASSPAATSQAGNTYGRKPPVGFAPRQGVKNRSASVASIRPTPNSYQEVTDENVNFDRETNEFMASLDDQDLEPPPRPKPSNAKRRRAARIPSGEEEDDDKGDEGIAGEGEKSGRENDKEEEDEEEKEEEEEEEEDDKISTRARRNPQSRIGLPIKKRRNPTATEPSKRPSKKATTTTAAETISIDASEYLEMEASQRDDAAISSGDDEGSARETNESGGRGEEEEDEETESDKEFIDDRESINEDDEAAGNRPNPYLDSGELNKSPTASSGTSSSGKKLPVLIRSPRVVVNASERHMVQLNKEIERLRNKKAEHRSDEQFYKIDRSTAATSSASVAATPAAPPASGPSKRGGSQTASSGDVHQSAGPSKPPPPPVETPASSPQKSENRGKRTYRQVVLAPRQQNN